MPDVYPDDFQPGMIVRRNCGYAHEGMENGDEAAIYEVLPSGYLTFREYADSRFASSNYERVGPGPKKIRIKQGFALFITEIEGRDEPS